MLQRPGLRIHKVDLPILRRRDKAPINVDDRVNPLIVVLELVLDLPDAIILLPSNDQAVLVARQDQRVLHLLMLDQIMIVNAQHLG